MAKTDQYGKVNYHFSSHFKLYDAVLEETTNEHRITFCLSYQNLSFCFNHPLRNLQLLLKYMHYINMLYFGMHLLLVLYLFL